MWGRIYIIFSLSDFNLTDYFAKIRAMADSAALVVKNLKKHFGSTKAVDGINFEVKKGEIFSFLGPNA